MDVLSLCPLRAAGILFHPSTDRCTLALACKATYRLEPVVSPLSEHQEELNVEDNHWDDDPQRSLYSASDIIPFKLRADVVLVGQACAPGATPARSFMTRIVIGDIDKSIEVFGERFFVRSGELREGAKIVKLSLRYERAAGGPGTWNPVGVRMDQTDSHGTIALPNLQPPGLHFARPGDFIPPTGYGPIAPSWPSRAERIAALRAQQWNPDAWSKSPLPERLDPAFFNAAPPDQQVSELRADERLVLENLLPAHPRLITNLPGIEPQAVVMRSTGRQEAVPLAIDTLWIDTAHGICTLVWRGQIPLTHPAEQGRVVVTMGERRPSIHEIGAIALMGDMPIAADDPDGSVTVTLSPSAPSEARPVTPFVPAQPFEGAIPIAQTPKTNVAPINMGLPFTPKGMSPAVPRDPKEEDDVTVSLDGDAPFLGITSSPVEPLPFRATPAAASAPSPPPAVMPVHSSPAPLIALTTASTGGAAPWVLGPAPQQVVTVESRTEAGLGDKNLAGVEPPPLIGPLATVEMLEREARRKDETENRSQAPSEEPAVAVPEPIAAEKVLPIEQCAAIAASMARRKADAAQILKDNELDAAKWSATEQHWVGEIRKETGRGKSTLLKAFDTAYVGRLEDERGPIRVEEYARLVVASERGSVDEVLAELSLPRGARLRIERVFLRKTAGDPAFGEKVRKAVEAAREE